MLKAALFTFLSCKFTTGSGWVSKSSGKGRSASEGVRQTRSQQFAKDCSAENT